MKVQTVQSARKVPGRCESCGKDIGIGGSYKYVKPRYGARRVRHVDCPMWRPSELASGKIATAYAAQEGAHDELDALEHPDSWGFCEMWLDDVRVILSGCAAGANDCRDEYQEGFDNLPENFQNSQTGEEIQEKIDLLESWADELESPTLPDVPDDPENHDIDSWCDEVKGDASDLIDALEI